MSCPRDGQKKAPAAKGLELRAAGANYGPSIRRSSVTVCSNAHFGDAKTFRKISLTGERKSPLAVVTSGEIYRAENVMGQILNAVSSTTDRS